MEIKEPKIPREVFEQGCRAIQNAVYSLRGVSTPTEADRIYRQTEFNRDEGISGQLYFPFMI